MKRATFRLGTALALVLLAHSFLNGQYTSQPNQNETLSTHYVECSRDALGLPVGSRTEKTPVFTSADGSKAFGIVTAEYQPGRCENISRIFMVGAGGTHRELFHQGEETLPNGMVYDGNGVEAMRWSPSGIRLLVEISQWTWGTDFGWNTKYMFFTKDQPEPEQLTPEETIWQQFPHPCQMTIESLGWVDDRHIGFKAAPSQDHDEEGAPDPTPPCIDKVTRFIFDVTTQHLPPGG